jgi:hypothetical protein
MYQPMLFIHWKQARLVLLPFVVASFGLPLLSVGGLGGTLDGTWEAYRALSASQIWLPLYPVLAAAIGVTVALTTWNWDHQLKHVYALSLPLARWEYVLLKMGAGVVLCLAPTLALWIGAHLAASSISLPEGLQAYPNALAVRFLMAILVSYAALFAAAAGTVKTTLYVVTGFILLLFLSGTVPGLIANFFPSLANQDLGVWVFRMLVEAPGPFGVFTGTWSLIDV